MGNLGKSIIGLVVYAPLAGLNMLAEMVVRKTEPALLWFERDLQAGPDPDGPDVDGDDTDDIVTEPDAADWEKP